MYTVSQLAKLSGLSIRTLHHYDEINLLKPAYITQTGHRRYSEDQLLVLQQILFFRELGFELKRIQEILTQNDLNRLQALKSHQILLKDKITRLKQLTKTLASTITHLEENQMIKNNQLFKGFEPESDQQAQYEKFLEEYLIQKYGKQKYEESKKGYKKVNYSKDDIHKIQQEWHAIGQELTELLENDYASASPEVQKLIGKHYELIKKFWTPTKESYAGHADFIIETELKNFYNAYHPKLAQFLADGIKIFADENL